MRKLNPKGKAEKIVQSTGDEASNLAFQPVEMGCRITLCTSRLRCGCYGAPSVFEPSVRRGGYDHGIMYYYAESSWETWSDRSHGGSADHA